MNTTMNRPYRGGVAERIAQQPDTVTVEIPGPSLDASESWCRMVTSIELSDLDRCGVDGPELKLGHTYELPYGAIVIIGDDHSDHHEVRVFKATANGLSLLKTWHLKSDRRRSVQIYMMRRMPVPVVTTVRQVDNELVNTGAPILPPVGASCRQS